MADTFELKSALGETVKYTVEEYPYGGATIDGRQGPDYEDIGDILLERIGIVARNAGGRVASLNVTTADVEGAKADAAKDRTEHGQDPDEEIGPQELLYRLVNFNPAAIVGGGVATAAGAVADLMRDVVREPIDGFDVRDLLLAVVDRTGKPGHPSRGDKTRMIKLGSRKGRDDAYYRNRGEMHAAMAIVLFTYYGSDVLVPFASVIDQLGLTSESIPG